MADEPKAKISCYWVPEGGLVKLSMYAGLCRPLGTTPALPEYRLTSGIVFCTPVSDHKDWVPIDDRYHLQMTQLHQKKRSFIQPFEPPATRLRTPHQPPRGSSGCCATHLMLDMNILSSGRSHQPIDLTLMIVHSFSQFNQRLEYSSRAQVGEPVEISKLIVQNLFMASTLLSIMFAL